MKDFTKDFFQTAWGKDGYYENFSYGVGIDKVCEVALFPFLSPDKDVLEIGCGGGVFTQRIKDVKSLTAIDVIKKPENITCNFIELKSNDYKCTGIKDNSIDFVFSYNVFCHLSNEALTEYLKSAYRVLRKGGDFVFMLSSFEHTKNHIEKNENPKRGDLLSMGHFYQDLETLPLIAGKEWKVVNSNMIPQHRDILIHLRK